MDDPLVAQVCEYKDLEERVEVRGHDARRV
jgi:hypothetical protein